MRMESASAFIDGKINELGDWRGKMREIIHKADAEIVEEWKSKVRIMRRPAQCALS